MPQELIEVSGLAHVDRKSGFQSVQRHLDRPRASTWPAISSLPTATGRTTPGFEILDLSADEITRPNDRTRSTTALRWRVHGGGAPFFGL